jgi:hypothetical protein
LLGPGVFALAEKILPRELALARNEGYGCVNLKKCAPALRPQPGAWIALVSGARSMASVSKSESTSPSPDPRKISAQSRDHAQSVLLDVQDELHELAAIIAMLPHLHHFAIVMHEIIQPGPRRANVPTACHDRIGRLLHELPRKQQAATNKALERFTSHDRLTDVELMDLTSALEVMTRSIEYRLQRVCGLLAAV